MTEIILFHHAQGRTPGIHRFADTLRAAGHTVHTPDVFEGRTFATVDEGVAHAKELGFEEVFERGIRAGQALPAEIVYAGFSLGAMPAEHLAINRPGARGALLLEGCAPLEEFGGSWPAEVPVQIHGMDRDPWFADGGDLDAAKELVEAAADGELFVYPGDQHLFSDTSLPSYRAQAAELLLQRVLECLARV